MYISPICFITLGLVFMYQSPVSAEHQPTQNWWQRLPLSSKERTLLESTLTSLHRRKGSNTPISYSVSDPILVACADASVEDPSQSSSGNVPISIPQLRNLQFPNPLDKISQVPTCAS
jgi:hypothetical protein